MGEPTSRSRLSAVFLVATGWLVGASVSAQTPRPGGVPSEPSEASGVGLLPQGDVFRPLIADPKQPVGFGETFGIVRWPGRRPGDGLQLGIAGGVFAQFAIERRLTNLVNTDWVIGFPLTYRRGDLSARLRVYHQSSHLGDGFLLRVHPQRVNRTFEAVELIVSEEFGPWRVYGGGEYVFRREPPDLEAGVLHGGLEYRRPTPLFGFGKLGTARLVAALDAKSWRQHEWAEAGSARAGLEFGPAGQAERTGRGRWWSLLLEFYDGLSPYGQLYTEELVLGGVGVHLGF